MGGRALHLTTMPELDNATSFVSAGHMNRVIGWTLILSGMILAAVLDSWFFKPQSGVEYASSIRPAVRHVQGVVLGMSLLQLGFGYLLATSVSDRRVRQTVATWTALGATIYTAGYVLGLAWSSCHWLVLAGSLLNFAGFACLLWTHPVGDQAVWINRIVPIVCFGMLLDFAAGLFVVLPGDIVLEYIGAADGVRLRMMRLARVAAIALSVLTLLYYSSPGRSASNRRAADWGGLALTCGAIGMPLLLSAASFASLQWKYLLVFPAVATVVGVYYAFISSLRRATWLECWGWGLIAISTSAGMLMGLYAFDGPLTTPDFLGGYNETPRRLSWLAHSYCIVLGIMAIFLARELHGPTGSDGLQNAGRLLFIAGRLLFIAGSGVTIGVLASQIVATSATRFLTLGPALVVIGAAACLVSIRRRPNSSADKSE